MSRFKVFNPADYKMVNGKVVPKFQPGGQYNPKGTTATGEEYDRSGDPGEDFAIENDYSGTKEEIEKWAAAQGYPGYGDDKLGEKYIKTDSQGFKHYKIADIDGSGTSVYLIKDGDEVIETQTYQKDASGNVIDDSFVRRVYTENYAETYTGKANPQYTGIGPGYAGYEYRKKGWEGNEYQKNIDQYQKLLTDPKNKNMVDAMYNRYKDKAAYNSLPVISRDQFVESLLEGQRQNALMLSVYGKDIADATYWDKPNTWASQHKNREGTNLKAYSDHQNQVYENAARELGFTAMDSDQAKQFQTAYNAASEIANTPEFMETYRSAGFEADPKGVKQPGEPGYLSGVEGKWGNTTNRYLASLREDIPEEKKKEDPANPEEVYYCVEDDSGSRVMGPFTPSDPAPPGATSGPSNKETADKICNVKAQELEPSAPAPDTWFGNDVRNYITGLGQKMFKGRPGLFQVDPAPYGYALESPDTLIAATTGMSNQYNTMLQNTMAGPAAAAASLGAQGTFLNQLSQDIAGVQNRNVNRLNEAYGQRAQIAQNVNALNTQARKQFLDESNIYGQERVNAMNKRAAMIGNLYNRGEENRFNDEMLRSIYPQATYPNRLNMGRTWDFSGQGKNPFLPDTSGSSGETTVDLNAGAFDAYNTAYEQHLGQYGNEEAARQYAQNVQKEYYTRNRNASNQNQGYAQARVRQNQSATGKTGGSMKFGANFTTPWGY